jgi:long-subunit fatty acid transport protein
MQHLRRHGLVGIVALAAALVAPATATAGGFGIPEVGTLRTAMGTVIGRPDDLSAIYHSPAGLILSHGWRLYVTGGLSLLSTEFRLAPWDQSDRLLGATPLADGYYAAVRPSRALGVIPMIAASAEILPDKLVLGAALYVGNGTGAAFDRAAVTHYHLIDGYVVSPQGSIAAAYRLTPDVTVGATVGVMNMRVHGERYVFPIINGSDLTSVAGSKPDLVLDGSGWAPTWSLGVFGQPHPKVTYGLALIGRTDVTHSGPVQITYSADAPTPGDTLAGTQTTTQMLPWTFQGGGAVDISPHVEVAGDLRYWLYRQFQASHTDVKGIFLLRAIDTVKNYHDSWELAGGVRVHDLDAAPRLELMAGTNYDHSPAPPETVTLDQPSFSHLGLHGGARYTLGRYRLAASYVHYWYQIPTITGSITSPPSNIMGSGTNHIMTVSVEVAL